MGKTRIKISYPCPVCDKSCGGGTIHWDSASWRQSVFWEWSTYCYTSNM